MLNYQISEDNNVTKIELSEKISIEEADQLKDVLMEVLSNSEQIEVCVDKLDRADIPVLQLIGSAQKSAQRNKKEMILTGISSQGFNSTLERSGFDNICDQKSNKTETCLWLETTK